MDVKAVPPPAPVPAPAATLSSTSGRTERNTEPNILGPAVTLAIGDGGAGPTAEAVQPTTADQGIYTRDAESQALVFQVLDPSSGDVVIQIPNAVVLRARAYEAAQSTPSQSGATLRTQA